MLPTCEGQTITNILIMVNKVQEALAVFAANEDQIQTACRKKKPSNFNYLGYISTLNNLWPTWVSEW